MQCETRLAGCSIQIEGLRGRWLMKQTCPCSAVAPCASRSEEAHPCLRPGLSGSQGGVRATRLLRREFHHHDQKYRGPPPPSETSGSDFARLSRKIAAAGLLGRRPGYYALRITLVAGLCVGGWRLALMGPSWWTLAIAAFLAVAFGQVALLAHDGAHRQVFRRRRASEVSGRIAGAGIGMGYGWWHDKHTRHHANPNHEELDPDLDPDLLVWSQDQAGPGRAGPGRQGSPPPDRPLAGVPVLSAPHAGWLQPARVEREGAGQSLTQAPNARRHLAVRALRCLPDRPALAVAIRHGDRLPRRPPGPVRRLPRLSLRAEPQGHADPDGGALAGQGAPGHRMRRGRTVIR